jgi:large subunit ribosomal protein L10
MSKLIKQMEMDALRQAFKGVRDMVMMSAVGLDCHADNQLRLSLRKKNIRLQVVKNSLVQRVFTDLGIKINTAGSWTGPTVVAWGGSSLAELTRELDTLLKKNNKIQVKSAVADGQEVTFKQALAMPTKAEAIGRVISLALSPASRLVSQILAPAARIAGQIKTLRERTPPAEGAEPAPAESSQQPG